MQTFLPFVDFYSSLECLDRRRLGKQRIEAYQILRAITYPAYGWQNHPAVNMWRGFPEALVDYALTACEVWTERGHNDTVADKIYIEFGQYIVDSPKYPLWLTDMHVHGSHRAMLYRKDPSFYSSFEPDSKLYNEYVWPT